MRTVSFALAGSLMLLTSCGGAQTSQTNNGQSNISSDPRAATNASSSNLQLRVSAGNAAKIMHERHEGMEKIGKNAKAINRELTGASPDLTVVRAGAAQIAALSKQASDWFPAGTGPEAGKTGAKAEIWQSPQDFSGKLRNFQAAAAAFNASAAMTDVAQIRVRFGDLEHACKACHDKYRAEMHH